MTTPNDTSDRMSRERSDTLPDVRISNPDSSGFSVRPSVASRTYYFDSRLAIIPGVTIPLRAMLVAGGSEQILVSPVGTADEAAMAGAQPLVVVAPSLLHHKHLEVALERYRPVALWGPPGLAKKKPELVPVHVFGIDPWPYDDVLEFVVVDGAPRRNEVVFFHPPSRTIYTADLFFNIREPEGMLAPLAFRMMGIHRRFATARMWRRWITDRNAFARSIDQILTWDFDRIVVAHGEVVDHDARAQFIAALREHDLIE
jgi:hypothetical protein